MWDQDGVHEIYRGWRKVLDVLRRSPTASCAPRRGSSPAHRLARYVRPDEMHQAFNFDFLDAHWDATALRDRHRGLAALQRRRRRADHVGAVEPRRRAARLAARPRPVAAAAQRHPGRRPAAGCRARPAPGPRRDRADARAARRRLRLPGRGARAARAHDDARRVPPGPDLPPHRRQGHRPRRLPGADAVGQGTRRATGSARATRPWLPQPDVYADLAVDQQEGVAGSTLELYRALLAYRREHRLGHGSLAWDALSSDTVVALRNTAGDGERTLLVVTNLGADPVALPGRRGARRVGPAHRRRRRCRPTPRSGSACRWPDVRAERLRLPRPADPGGPRPPGRGRLRAERRPREHPRRRSAGPSRWATATSRPTCTRPATASSSPSTTRVLDRVSDARGAIVDAAVRGGARGADRRGRADPAAVELFEEFPDTRINIDIKADDAARPDGREVLRHDATERVCIGSFSERRLRAARAALGPAGRDGGRPGGHRAAALHPRGR